MVFQTILSANDVGRASQLHVISSSIPADLETPVSAYLKLKKHGAKCLLESVEAGTIVGRYSFIGMRPEFRIIVTREQIEIKNGKTAMAIPLTSEKSALSVIKSLLQQVKLTGVHDQPRLLGGAVGFISYDFVRCFEKIPDLLPDDLHLPLAMFHMIDTLLVFDHVRRKIDILCLTDASTEKEAEDKINQIKATLLEPLSLPSSERCQVPSVEPVSDLTPDQFCRAVDDVKRHIKAGDVYQQVISRRLRGSTSADPFLVYRSLRMLNPSPYMYFLDFDDVVLIGSSPEAMVRLENRIATIRPIAGTRPRGTTEDEDRKLSEELLADEKERAEHVMLVDLGRNDLGRCCEIGTVKVTDFMIVERFSHVMHLTSNVTGKLNPGLDQFDLFQAAFPAGTVTGAPKIRAMQLIEEIEKTKRGPYAGAVGYFSLSGDSDWCINIRNITMKGQDYYLQAGAGIVADSVPANEFAETESKMAALKKAIEIAERGLR